MVSNNHPTPIRIAIDYGTSGSSVAVVLASSPRAPKMCQVGTNSVSSGVLFKVPGEMLVSLYADDHVDIDPLENKQVWQILDKKPTTPREHFVISSAKLLLDPARCKGDGQAAKEAKLLEDANVSPWDLYQIHMKMVLDAVKKQYDIHGCENWCLTVPDIYTLKSKRGEALQLEMAEKFTTVRCKLLRKDEELDQLLYEKFHKQLDFESESVAAAKGLALKEKDIHPLVRDENKIPLLVWDAGASTVDIAFAFLKNDGSLYFVETGGATSGTHYVWDEIRKMCTTRETKECRQQSLYKEIKDAVGQMEKLGNVGSYIPQSQLVKILDEAYCKAISTTRDLLRRSQKQGYPAPSIHIVGRASSSNEMLGRYLTSKLQKLLATVYSGQELPEVQCPKDLVALNLVSRGAAVPYSTDAVEAFKNATVAYECHVDDADGMLPPDFGGAHTCLVTMKKADEAEPSADWGKVSIVPATKELKLFVILPGQVPVMRGGFGYYDTNAGIPMSVLPLHLYLRDRAAEADSISFRLRRPDQDKPEHIEMDLKCRLTGETIVVQGDLLKDSERLQWRFKDLDGNEYRGEEEVVYAFPNSEPDVSNGTRTLGKRKRHGQRTGGVKRSGASMTKHKDDAEIRREKLAAELEGRPRLPTHEEEDRAVEAIIDAFPGLAISVY